MDLTRLPPSHPTADELASAVAELVRIPSVNPLQTGPVAERAGPPGERALAHHLAERFIEVGADEVELDEIVDGRPNVYARIDGRTDRLVVLDVHTDTVTVEHMTDPPFDGRIENGHVWGRGALDTKASLGVILALLAAWRRTGVRPEPSLLVVGSISEESGGLIGAGRFRDRVTERALEIDQMIIAEPTRLAPIHGHKGGIALRVTAHGTAAHSALPHLGANAIDAMVPVIEAYAAEHRRLSDIPAASELGPATVSVTMIEGGSGPNVIPAACSITVGARTVPEVRAADMYQRLVSIAEGACPLPVTCEPLQPPQPDGTYGSDAFYHPAGSGLVTSLAAWAGTEPTVAPFGTNALRYGDFRGEMAVFGPGSIDDAHQATECVSIADLERTAEVYRRWLAPG